MAKDAASRLVEHEAAQRLVGGDEAALLPQRVARRRRDAADDHVADLAFGMAAHHMDRLRRAHRLPFIRSSAAIMRRRRARRNVPPASHSHRDRPASRPVRFIVDAVSALAVVFRPLKGRCQMLYAILCYALGRRRHRPGPRNRTTRCMAEPRRRSGEIRQGRQARPGRPAAADHGGDDAAQGEGRAAGARRTLRRNQGTAARLLHDRVPTVSTKPSASRANLSDANPSGGSYEIRPVGVYSPVTPTI